MEVLLLRENKKYYAFPIDKVIHILENPQIIPYAFTSEAVKGVCNYYGSPVLYADVFNLHSPYKVPFGLILEEEIRVCIGVSCLMHTVLIPESAIPVRGDFSFQFTKVAYRIRNRMVEIIDVKKLISWLINSLKEEER